jgi:hypothetical protein
MIALEGVERGADGLEVTGDATGPGGALGADNQWNRDRHQDHEDPDHHEDLDERKRAPTSPAGDDER